MGRESRCALVRYTSGVLWSGVPQVCSGQVCLRCALVRYTSGVLWSGVPQVCSGQVCHTHTHTHTGRCVNGSAGSSVCAVWAESAAQ
ncbi:hypothetical protein ANANG_G00094910 [Anguilla anguilla]|uniref:Uncharacterized protein n=1 Tax=Anguilla anguilla TaxID=7936 RepID=A0A9D3MG81_ANGAN|nr:hypothetical protein ANANG_G00094910 [Anguilla anguilla]